MNLAARLTAGHRGALPRIKRGSGGLPEWVARVAFLMGNKFALAIFGRDGLEARRADGIDRCVRIASVGEWDKDSHYGTLLAVRRFRELEESCYLGEALMARIGLRLLARLSRIAHFCLNVHFSSERRFIEIRIFSYTRGRARFLALVLVKLKSLLARSDDIAYRAL